MTDTQPTFKKDWYKSFLVSIENSVGSLMFKNFICDDGTGQSVDVLEDGNLACAVYVSYILKIFDKIKETHTTVVATEADIKDFGWKEVSISEVQPGDVVVWGPGPRSNGHSHIGFAIGNNFAISNNAQNKFPIKHDLNYDGTRLAIRAYRTTWEM